jgi:hypothetical protein
MGTATPPQLWFLRQANRTGAALDHIFNKESDIGHLNWGDFHSALVALQRSMPVWDSGLVPLPSDFPKPVLAMPKANFAPDMVWLTGLILASRKLREVLDQPGDVVQFSPVEIVSGNAAAYAQDYRLMRVLARQPVMDVERSECESEWFTSPFTGETVMLTQFVKYLSLLPGLVPASEIFCVAESRGHILVTDALAARVLESGCTGIEFQNADDRLSGTRIEHLRTVNGIAERRVGFLK